MATPAQNRAARRSAASVARRAPSAAPDVLEDVLDPTDDEDQIPEKIVAGGPENAASPHPQSPTQGDPNLSRRRAATVLPVRQGSAGPLAQVEPDRTRQIETSDLIMPKLKISQAMSKVNTEYSATKGKSGVAMGNWYHTTTGKDLGDTVYFVPVDMRKSRSMFVQGQGVVCRSFDLLHGEGDPGIECEGSMQERHEYPEDQRGCALRLWKRDGDRNTPPPCGLTYTYFGLVIQDIENPEKSPILTAALQLRSTATGTARQINTLASTLAEGIWSDVILELGLESKTNFRGTFFVPTVDYYDTTEAEGFERIRRRAQAFAKQVGAADMRATIESGAADVD